MKIKSLCCLFLLVATCAVFGQTDDLNKLRETTDALDKPNGLYKAARLNGGIYIVRSDNHGFVVFDDLWRIAESSDVVVVGTPIDRKVRLLDEGRVVATLYKFTVEEVIQGKRSIGTTANLWIPGGAVNFSDGTKVGVYAPRYKELTMGGRYVLYLEKVKVADAPPETFFPTGGPQGIFELDKNHRVIPHADPKDLMAKHKGREEQDFLNEARNKRCRDKD